MALDKKVSAWLSKSDYEYVEALGNGNVGEGIRQVIANSQKLNANFWNDVKYIADVLREANKQRAKE